MKLRVRCRLRVYMMNVVTTELFPIVLSLFLELIYGLHDSSRYKMKPISVEIRGVTGTNPVWDTFVTVLPALLGKVMEMDKRDSQHQKEHKGMSWNGERMVKIG